LLFADRFVGAAFIGRDGRGTNPETGEGREQEQCAEVQ
jgi:hypothetical protein